MKIIKFNEGISPEVDNMFKELSFHDKKHREIDSKLAAICMETIQPLLDEYDIDGAKKFHREFYSPCIRKNEDDDDCDFSFEKDMVSYKINQAAKVKKDSENFNI